MRLAKPVFWLLVLVVAYTLGHAVWYWQTPLGQYPVLDGLENLILAGNLKEGILPRDPFYRAMLYPAVLSVLPLNWIVFGVLLPWPNTLLSMRLSLKIWGSQYAALISGALVGFNPVLLHFALDPLDITLSITLLLLGLNCIIPKQGAPFPQIGLFSLAGLFFSLAALSRPHFHALLLPLSVLCVGALLFYKPGRHRAAAFLGAASIPLIVFGLIQNAHSGTFRIMPTQGAYSFWVSNNSNANGLFYRQSLNFHYTDEHKNPARLEAEEIYRRKMGEPGTVDERSSFWKKETLDYIYNHPATWIRLMLFKSYAWLNNYEQYNNKTYSFHKSLSPYLKYNPICWGILLVLGVLSVLLRSTGSNKTVIWGMLALVALYSAGALLYMASARFRLPLTPILSIIAGGAPVALIKWKAVIKGTRVKTAIFAASAAIIAFSNFGSIASRDTVQQDAMLLADAASRMGRDYDAYQWSNRTLSLNPNRQDARRLRFLSYFNLVAMGQHPQTGKTWADFEADIDAITLSDPFLDFTKGVALWNLGQVDAARNAWIGNFNQFSWNASSSLAALLYTRSPIPFPIPQYPTEALPPDPMLLFALNKIGDSELRESIGFHFSKPDSFYRSVEESIKRVLPEGFEK